ncbi:hypothetical protein [Chamaesiphon sp. VAR_48_metabat_135_sub]|uniref:hypothetical protein n=1 Tax=Chamaesiphon sp. VAR_48_metabat_135_sub TaxID=2964699 RepID=UPI00286A6614|nr:hypothetical protein [Chamaesiphon sp. VAR_48_metabat_135_sub]
MSIHKSDYEKLLSKYSNHTEAVELLKQYRPYLEMIPSIRRSEESLMTMPLPVVKLRKVPLGQQVDRFSPITTTSKTILLPCDLAYLMCDPEWKIKMGGEIIIFIHRPEEDLSDLLARWRQTQVLLDHDYEWVMPQYYRHIICESAEHLYPLFILFDRSDRSIKEGLTGAHLPFVTAPIQQIHVAELTLPDRGTELSDL